MKGIKIFLNFLIQLKKQGILINPHQCYYQHVFAEGHPTYFDVSVRNTLQPGNLNRASVNAGAAAVAGEIEKDQKHTAKVERSGGRFYPLVVKTLGVWTASSLTTLRTIAARTTVRSGLTTKLALRNLIEQLSIKCWAYNAKMMLHHLSYLPGNTSQWKVS